MLLRTPATLCFLAAAFALNGCVVYTNPEPVRYARPNGRAVIVATRPTHPLAAPTTPATNPVTAPTTPTTIPVAPTLPQDKGMAIISRTQPAARVPAPAALSTIVRAPRVTTPTIFGNGSGGAFRGEAFVIPETTHNLPDLNALVPFATLFTDSFEVKPQTFSGGFPGALKQEDWFAIRYDGFFQLDAGGTYDFELTSDDGTILTIDGQFVLNNDGVHAVNTVTQTFTLRPGVHQLRLDYFQGPKGQVALGLRFGPHGTAASTFAPLHGIATPPR